MSYKFYEMEVLRWAEDRKIIPNSTAMAQTIKTLEGLGKLMKATRSDDKAAQADAYGDILVTLIIGAALADIDLVAALGSAYSRIDERFVKEPA